jgi:hypothetical protein
LSNYGALQLLSHLQRRGHWPLNELVLGHQALALPGRKVDAGGVVLHCGK